MKKRFILLVALAALSMGLIGCTGFNASIPVTVATDIAFVEALKNNPDRVPGIVKALEDTNALLQKSVTYDDLLGFLTGKLGGEYAYIYVILHAYLDTDKPVFESWLPMLDGYKGELTKKIDHFIMIAGLI